MNKSGSSQLLVQTTKLSEDDVRGVRDSYFREARTSVLLTFFIVTFLGSGIPGIVFIFWPFKYDYVVGFAIGSILGLIATGGLLAIEFRDYRLVRADLLSGHCEVLQVSALGALSVSLNDKLPAIAFDCGNRTLVLSGNWQENIYRKAIWSDSRDRMRFPNSNFTLRRLSRTGRILKIEISGTKLRIEENDSIETLLEASVPIYVESFYIDKRLDKLITMRSGDHVK